MIRQKSKKRAALKKEYDLAVAVVRERDQTCVCDRWSTVPCNYWGRPADPDHIVSLGRGGAYTDPNNIQLLCAADHALKTSVLCTIASILGLNGQESRETEHLKFAHGNPNGDWNEFVEACKRIWDAEKRYMLGGPKPEVRGK